MCVFILIFRVCVFRRKKIKDQSQWTTKDVFPLDRFFFFNSVVFITFFAQFSPKPHIALFLFIISCGFFFYSLSYLHIHSYALFLNTLLWLSSFSYFSTFHILVLLLSLRTSVLSIQMQILSVTSPASFCQERK